MSDTISTFDFAIGDLVFYPRNGIGTITQFSRETNPDYQCDLAHIELSHHSKDLKVAIGTRSCQLKHLSAFTGPEPLKLARQLLSEKPGPTSPLTGRWGPRFIMLEAKFMKATTLAEVLAVTRDICRPSHSNVAQSEVALLQVLRRWLVEAIAKVESMTEEQVLHELNHILISARKHPFPA